MSLSRYLRESQKQAAAYTDIAAYQNVSEEAKLRTRVAVGTLPWKRGE